VIGCLLLAAACGSASPTAPSHAAASLPLTGGVPLHPVTFKPKLVSVAAGSEFSVVVDRTDGPEEWELTAKGEPAIIQGQGSAQIGSCGSPPKAGCALPEQYTFLAKARGTTTMVWTEYALVCPSQPARACPAVTQPIEVTVT
jgi:hypothetical protein